MDQSVGLVSSAGFYRAVSKTGSTSLLVTNLKGQTRLDVCQKPIEWKSAVRTETIRLARRLRMFGFLTQSRKVAKNRKEIGLLFWSNSEREIPISTCRLVFANLCVFATLRQMIARILSQNVTITR
jgi:hypothetical protein